MALLESGKIFYINCGLKDYIDEYGGDKTLGEYYEWFAHQFSSILNITDEEYSKIHKYKTYGNNNICFLLPYIHKNNYKNKLLLYFSERDESSYCSNVSSLEILITAYEYSNEYYTDGYFNDNFIKFYTNYIYKNNNNNIFYNDSTQRSMGRDYYTTIIIDTRFLDSHRFYTIGCINESNAKLKDIKEIYSSPSTFVCELTDKLNNQKSDGVFSFCYTTGSYYSTYEDIYNDDSMSGETIGVPSIMSIIPEIAHDNSNAWYYDWSFYPQYFTKEKNSFSIIKTHFGRLKPSGDIYLTMGNMLPELASFSNYQNMLEEKDSWKRRKIIKEDEYGNNQIFSVGLNNSHTKFYFNKYDWIPVIKEDPEKPQPEVKGYLEFSSDGDFYLVVSSKRWNGTMEYSIDDGSTWGVWDGSKINGASTQSILLKGTGNSIITGDLSSYRWTFTGKYIKGNIETLLDYQTVLNGEHPSMGAFCYNYMFFNCTSLIEAPELPATTLADYCYNNMFYNCTSLIEAPELPATTLANNCYSSMFSNCTSLIEAPKLPATTLSSYCYYCMFYGCTSLIKVPELPATTLADHCYSDMFVNCSSLVETHKILPALTLADGCYHSMYYNCSSIVKTYKSLLPATTLANDCYRSMFSGCSSLKNAPELPATTLADYCYYYMFYNCTSLEEICELPATTLKPYCYNNMFRKCSKIKLSTSKTGIYTNNYRIPFDGNGTNASYALNVMFYETGGSFTGTPAINTTYYTSNEVI